MTYAPDDLIEAQRQIDSILHKLTEAEKTLSAKPNADALKSQITLARRRIKALGIARELIAREIAG